MYRNNGTLWFSENLIQFRRFYIDHFGKLHRNDSRIRSVALNRDHQIDSKKAIQNQTKAEVNRFYFQIKNSERLIELYQKTLIPQAERTIEAIDQTGNITELLEAQSIWLNFHLAWVRAIADHHQDSARLQRLIGKEIRWECFLNPSLSCYSFSLPGER